MGRSSVLETERGSGPTQDLLGRCDGPPEVARHLWHRQPVHVPEHEGEPVGGVERLQHLTRPRVVVDLERRLGVVRLAADQA